MKVARAIDPGRLKVLPLETRRSLSPIDRIRIDPSSPPPSLPAEQNRLIEQCSKEIRAALKNGSAVILMYGAHLIKNGAMTIVNAMVKDGALKHLATNGAGSIHDWELAFLGRTEESVRENIATGTFGTWDETSRFIHVALLAGGIKGQGYGASLGQFIVENGTMLPTVEALEKSIRDDPRDPLTPARAELLGAMLRLGLQGGAVRVDHAWSSHSILAEAFRCNVPLTVHPGIGYDIISNHPIFSGAAIGRAAAADFHLLAGTMQNLEGGVVLSVGSAIMAPQVFEKAASCVNNLALQEKGGKVLKDFSIYVVDLQDGGNWDWTRGEPPKTNAAYYLRFCKSYSRMGGRMQYLQCDNAAFLHNLYRRVMD